MSSKIGKTVHISNNCSTAQLTTDRKNPFETLNYIVSVLYFVSDFQVTVIIRENCRLKDTIPDLFRLSRMRKLFVGFVFLIQADQQGGLTDQNSGYFQKGYRKLEKQIADFREEDTDLFSQADL
ncbi:hypothetical protein WA026_017040 [Henosepilachna vigintioctopunctata]|uniref:Uncharacterized protein n=1 Tax=Henosepilachna vigintioctopunctata TaxID=420089 RepID=A0AAW1TVZ0_9CUCU